MNPHAGNILCYFWIWFANAILTFGAHIDARQYFTAENFKKIGKTINEADEEIMGIKGWSEMPDLEVGRRK